MLKQRAESLGRLRKIGLASVMYAADHNEKYPDSLDKLKPYIQEDDVLDWAKDNVAYLGHGKSITADPQTAIAYDKTLLKKENSEDTNVLYSDTHVAFRKTKQLKQQGLIPKKKPAVQVEIAQWGSIPIKHSRWYDRRFESIAFVRCKMPIQMDESGLRPLVSRKDVIAGEQASYAAIMRSESFLSRVLQRIKVRQTQWFQQYSKNPEKRIVSLKDSFSAWPIKNTEYVKVSMKTKKPKEAKLILDEALKEFQQHSEKLETFPNTKPVPNKKIDVQVETKNVEKINWVVEDYGQTRLLSNKERPEVDWVSIVASVVKNNGRYLVPDNGLTLKELIKAAGYNKDKLDESYVTVSREIKQGSQRAFKHYSRNLETLFSGKESDIPLKHGDGVIGGYIRPSPNDEEFWGRYSFSDVVELTVNNDGAKVDMFADLDTAKLITPPEKLDNTDENAVPKWIKENGIDVMGETADSVRGLVGFNIYATRVDNYFWDVDKFQITDRLTTCMNEMILLSADNVLPVTYLINTSEHTMGVLQILGFAENPRGIKIRYKLLHKTDV